MFYRKKQDYWCINCNKYARDPVRKMCTPHFFSYEYFEEIVLKEIKNQLYNLFNDLNINKLNEEIIKRTKNNTDEYKNKKENIIKEQNKLLKNIQIIYKDRLEGNITPNQYKLLSKPYEAKLKNLNKGLKNINMV